MGKASEIIKSVNPHSRAHRYAVSLSATPLWSEIPRATVTSPCPSDPGSLQSTAEPTESSRLVVLSANTPNIPTALDLQPRRGGAEPSSHAVFHHPPQRPRCRLAAVPGAGARRWPRKPSCPQLSPAVRVPQGPVPGGNSAPLKIAARGCCCAGTPGGSGARGCPGHSAAGPASCPPGLGRAGRSSRGAPGPGTARPSPRVILVGPGGAGLQGAAPGPSLPRRRPRQGKFYPTRRGGQGAGHGAVSTGEGLWLLLGSLPAPRGMEQGREG